jgi:hypothetical protein
MARRTGSEAHPQAWVRLKERHDRELKGYTDFFAVEERRRRLVEEIEMLEVEAATAVSTVVSLSDPATVAEVIEWSQTKVRAAVKLAAAHAPDDAVGSNGVHTAADGGS